MMRTLVVIRSFALSFAASLAVSGVAWGAERAPAPADASRLEALRAETGVEGFELAVEPRPFVFPRDHGPHPTFRHEWWYLTGHLDAATGEPFGFELTFFRFALKPKPQPGTEAVASGDEAATPGAPSRRATPSAWRSNQIYMAHFAVTDIERREFHVEERFAREALGLAGASAEPFRVTLDDWSLAEIESPPGASELPDDASGAIDAASRASNPVSRASNSGAPGDPRPWRLIAADERYALDLVLTPASPIALNGEAGLSRKSDAPGAASYYYSIPRMTAKGRLSREGRTFDVQGAVWLDREWGSGSLGSDQQGWDWFAVQLDDGSALMFYALRNHNGEIDAHSAGTWVSPDGAVRTLSRREVELEVRDHWTSPRGGRYPARWRLRVPSLQLDLDILPRLADQELDTSTRYWEGACLVSGRRGDGEIRGRAYVELVGYARSSAGER